MKKKWSKIGTLRDSTLDRFIRKIIYCRVRPRVLTASKALAKSRKTPAAY